MFKLVARGEFEFLQPLLNALRSKQPNRLARFEDMDAYDIDEIIEKQQLLIPHAGAPKGDKAPGTSIVARAAAHIRSALGLTEADARRLVERVLTKAHKSHGKLVEDALAAYFKSREEPDEPIADAA
jgi:hypothetical protein